jgi:hypothetical protein
LENKITESLTPKDEVPYRFGEKYTPEELDRLSKFMHADFPHTTYGGGRYKEVIIENPPKEICDPKKWKNILDTVFLPEWENFDLRLKTHKKITVRFIDKLHDYHNNVNAGGNSIAYNNDEFCRINFKRDSGQNKTVEDLAFVLMHELAEGDFWSKTLEDDQEAHIEHINEINILKTGEQNYRHLLDEKIANRRALRAIRRMWPNVKWINPEDEFEEDK